MFSSLPFTLPFFSIMVFGTIFSISSSHWFGIWAGLEINLIGFLPLLVYQKSMSESESAVKYFTTQAMGSSFLMFGSLMSYGLFFTWEMAANSWVLGLILILVGLMTKTGIFPFHFWLPSVMAGLPWVSCLMLATWQKIAPLFLMATFLDSNLTYWLFMLFCIFSAGSSIIGGVGGMNQTQLRALIAYSSIGHLGWMLFAILHSSWAMKVYLSIYITISICIFLSLWYANTSTMGAMKTPVTNILGLGSTLIMFLSLGGLPPMLGFISKWAVIVISTKGVSWIFLLLLICGSLMSLFYYLSLFFSLFLVIFKNKKLLFENHTKKSLIVSLSLLLNVFGGLLLLTENFLYSI
uniref:NADH-ubiquinone oxidoreductase chain 2 n=2 Tax=Oncomelania hupensis TaxID=56141 RepID=C7S3L5_9CAEN|nr:NADH dehydrogenase subunit 2 [Oncomelania hupensis robertsoni]ABS87690.1 NADH dehydrogense subunit 2 [Oncomelania hupensis robertsoni]AEP39056.1 NADH dehydrogenase subunit 2 [Oncomelania hupensis hupensis]